MKELKLTKCMSYGWINERGKVKELKSGMVWGKLKTWDAAMKDWCG